MKEIIIEMDAAILAESGAALIAQWFKQQCDGDWEHSQGVKIETLDNPGWVVRIDLDGTPADDMQARGKYGDYEWEADKGCMTGMTDNPSVLDELLRVVWCALEFGNAKDRIERN